MIYITARHMDPSDSARHEHIAEVRWRNPADGATGASSRAVMVDWINEGNDAWVQDGAGGVRVGVVHGSPPYLRTFADGVYTNNLLSLPTY
jgi:hypothetical protein